MIIIVLIIQAFRFKINNQSLAIFHPFKIKTILIKLLYIIMQIDLQVFIYSKNTNHNNNSNLNFNINSKILIKLNYYSNNRLIQH